MLCKLGMHRYRWHMIESGVIAMLVKRCESCGIRAKLPKRT